jgi:hypothetical protein
MTYHKLQSKYSSPSIIPYSELIRTKEWLEKRESIISRDHNKCTKCDKTPTSTYYNHDTKSAMYLWYGEETPIYNKDKNGVMVEVESYIPIINADKPYFMQVHHRHYVLEKLPWEYQDEDLITLCNWCHWEFHEKNSVPVYKTVNDKLEKIYLQPCLRCYGSGSFPEFAHVQAGICFRCKGARFEQLIRH